MDTALLSFFNHYLSKKILRAVLKGCLLFGSWVFLLACNRRPHTVSFYYWRTHFFLETSEKQALADNDARELYTRYFDIDFSPADTAPMPVAIIRFDSLPAPVSIIPVIYIKNRVFEKIDALAAITLANKVNLLINDINRSAQLVTSQVQFDCDWTETTRNNYFTFLQQYKIISKQTISATIRLHQVKYRVRTGVPPVDYGSLMYYNMGTIGTGDENSIYDKSIAEKYNAYIESYPLALDIALPIFAWGLQLRDGKVIKLLNKMNFLHFDNDSNFTATAAGRYQVRNACFHGGYYFKQYDEIKSEHVPAEDLNGIIKQVNKYSNHKIRNIVFYDMDKENIILYDKNVFRKMVDRID